MTYATKIVASLLLVVLIAPPALLVAPEPAHAILGVGDIVYDPVNWVENALSAISDVLIEVNTYAQYIKTWVLDPLAFILSGDLLRSITAGVIDFINGVTNGSGRPQYVQDLRGHLLTVGDINALAFFAEFGNSNSPFSSTILSSLRGNYLIETSGTGFWFANQSTLPQYSQNPLAFVSGDFSQGGWSAWFALTTQPQNNPYLEYYAKRAELSTRVSQAVSSSLNELTWGDGFLSWCGDQSSTGGTTPDPNDPNAIPDSIAVTSALDCINADGSSGSTKTPGSVIKSTLDKVLGTDIDKLVNMGDISADVSSIFNNLASIVQTVGYGAQLLGAGGSGGLFGFGQPSAGGGPSPLDQYRNANGFLGSTVGSVTQTSQAVSSGDSLSTRITKYSTAWQTIKTATDNAAAALNQMAASCPITYDLAAARVTSDTINPVLAEYAAAQTTIQNAQTYLSQNPPATAISAISTDLIAQRNIVPTAGDVSTAETNATYQGSATASPPGSLYITGGSYLDVMTLVASRATALAGNCNSASTTTPPVI